MAESVDPAAVTEVSVVIGRASRIDGDRLLEVLAALAAQHDEVPHEVVLVDRVGGALLARAADTHPALAVVTATAEASLPALRAAGARRARAPIVAVLEDHTVPAAGWLRGLRDRLAQASPDVVAVGGVVENGVTERAFDRANFLCEYAAFTAPVDDGPTTALPGVNVAYRRADLLAAAAEELEGAFWEGPLHARWLAEGRTLVSAPEMRVVHRKRFTRRQFLRQRFLYSRAYAARRHRDRPALVRAAVAVATLALPALLLLRFARLARVKPELSRQRSAALVWLPVFFAAWTWGEAVGTIAGAGRAPAEIE